MWIQYDYLHTFLLSFGLGIVTHSALLNNGDLPESPRSTVVVGTLITFSSIGLQSLAKDFFGSRIY